MKSLRAVAYDGVVKQWYYIEDRQVKRWYLLALVRWPSHQTPVPALASAKTYKKILGWADKPKLRRDNLTLSIGDIDGESDHDLQPAKKRRRTARIRRHDAIIDRLPHVGPVGDKDPSSKSDSSTISIRTSVDASETLASEKSVGSVMSSKFNDKSSKSRKLFFTWAWAAPKYSREHCFHACCHSPMRSLLKPNLSSPIYTLIKGNSSMCA